MKRVGAALVAVALAWGATFAQEPDAELEDAFFELLTRCDSPVLVERNEAEDELARRFVEFEPVWQDRTFLTDGEISAESAHRFELAEARRRRDALDAAADSFSVDAEAGAVEDDGTRRCSFRVGYDDSVRVVYLTPLFSEFYWRDPSDDGVWRPRSRSSAPELEPEHGATSLEFETALERVDASEVDGLSERPAFEASIGVDVRPLFVSIARPGAKTRATQSGALKISDVAATRRSDGNWSVAFRVERFDAADAFDSWRAPIDARELAAVSSDSSTKLASLRVQTRDRSPRGFVAEALFPGGELDASFESGRAFLSIEAPRYIVRVRNR